MNLNIKLLIGTIYIVSFSALIFFIFNKFDFEEISNINFIKYNQVLIASLKENNEVLLLFGFFIFSVFWILLLGFASPLALAAGFIYGKWLGTLISVVSFSIGCTLLYYIASLFFKDFIKKKLTKKIEKFIIMFKKNEFLYFMLFRFTGGGMPFAIQNLVPVIFDMKIKNYFFSTLLGLIPSMFIINALGSGLDKFINENDSIVWKKLILNPEIYLPILGFFTILVIAFLLKKFFFYKKNY